MGNAYITNDVLLCPWLFFFLNASHIIEALNTEGSGKCSIAVKLSFVYYICPNVLLHFGFWLKQSTKAAIIAVLCKIKTRANANIYIESWLQFSHSYSYVFDIRSVWHFKQYLYALISFLSRTINNTSNTKTW